MHSVKSSSFFAINHDHNHKFRLKFAREAECTYGRDRVFCMRLGVYVFIKTEANIHKISQNFNFPKSSGWSFVPKLRLTGFQIRFQIFKLSFLKVICITIIFLPVTFYLLFYKHFYRHYAFDRFCHGVRLLSKKKRTKATELSLRIFSSWLHQNL